MTDNIHQNGVNPLDVPVIAKAQSRVLRAYWRLGNWRKVGERFGVHHRYAWDLGLHGTVPVNPAIRVKLFLPRLLPSERKRKVRRPFIPLGAAGWEDVYFRKVGKK